jgi:hypothetical protein
VRSNLERTVALWTPGATIPQTSGEFIFNLGDNSAIFDQFWVVVGRVIQGWHIVEQIAALPVADLSQTIEGPGADQFNRVPLLEEEPPPPLSQSFIRITQAQVIKPAGVPAFYEHRIYYPEGYSWERIVQSLEVVNPNNQAVEYQVLVRYERGERDQTIAVRNLAAQQRESLVISPELRQSELVRDHEPYAFEIWSTLPIAADLRHTDFGRTTRESFFNPEMLPTPTLMQNWTFNQTAFGLGASNIFLVWQNTAGADGQVTVTFFFRDADPQSFAFDLGPYRRGGLNLLDFQGLPATEDFVGAQVTSDVPIVASMTRYDRRPGVAGDREGGIATLGTFGGGSTVGIAPAARRGPVEPLTILNTSPQDIVVNFVLQPRPGIARTMEVIVPANRFLVLEGNDSPASLVPAGREYTITYDAQAPVTVGFVTSAFRGTGTSFATWAAREIHFADASVYVAPSGSPFGLSALSIFNPGPALADVELVFRFETGPEVATLPGAWRIPANTTQERRINDFNQRISQVRGGISDLTARSPYSLEVFSTTPVVAQTRLLHGEGRTELGMPLSPIVLLGQTAV